MEKIRTIEGKEYDLRPSSWILYDFLVENQGIDYTLKELTSHTGISYGKMYLYVKDLIQNGFVETYLDFNLEGKRLKYVKLISEVGNGISNVVISKKENPKKENPKKENPKKENPKKENPKKENPKQKVEFKISTEKEFLLRAVIKSAHRRAITQDESYKLLVKLINA